MGVKRVARWSWSIGCALALLGCDEDGGPEREPIVVDDDGSSDSESGNGPADDSTGTPSGGSETDGSDTDATANPTGFETDDSDTDVDPTDDSTTTTTTDPTDDRPPVQCVTQGGDLTMSGFVSASSVFDPWFGAPYEPELAVDGSTATSWFSAGPEDSGLPSTFEWYTQNDHCLDGLTLLGNADHSEADFREGFGFETIFVEVFDTAGATVYSQTHSLEGTPDPDLRIDLAGVPGNRIVLELSGHEAPDCGGFSELRIEGRATR